MKNRLNFQTLQHIDERDFDKLLDELSDENIIHVTGKKPADKTIRRTVS